MHKVKFKLLWQVDYYTENIYSSPFFGVIFGTSILNNSYNRLKYVFKQIISIVAIENICCVKTNKSMKFFFQDLLHFSTFSLNWYPDQEGACKFVKEIHVFLIC